MPYLLQVSMTCWSRIEPPGWTMAVTPERRARSMLSPKGKKASEPRQTPVTWLRYSFFSSAVRGAGCLAALGASALLAIVQFYMSPMSDNSFFFRIGFLVFIILLCVSAFKRAVAALNENAQTAVYKQLAYETSVKKKAEKQIADKRWHNIL